MVGSSSHERLPPGDSRVIALDSPTDLLASCSVVFTDVAIRTDYDDFPGTARGTPTVTAQTPTRQPLASDSGSSQTCVTLPRAVTESNPLRPDLNWVDRSCDAVHGTRVTLTSTGAGDDTMEAEAVGDTVDRRGDDADAGAHMDCDDDGEESGVPWVTVPWAALNCNAVPDSNALDMGSESRSCPNSGKKANKRGKRSGNQGGENREHMLATINKRVLGHPGGSS